MKTIIFNRTFQSLIFTGFVLMISACATTSETTANKPVEADRLTAESQKHETAPVVKEQTELKTPVQSKTLEPARTTIAPSWKS